MIKFLTLLFLIAALIGCKKDIVPTKPQYNQQIDDDGDVLRPKEGYGVVYRSAHYVDSMRNAKEAAVNVCPTVNGLSQSSSTSNTISLTWNDVGANRYDVYKETFPNSHVFLIDGTVSGTSYTMSSNLAPMTCYQVGVGAHNCPMTNTIQACTGKDVAIAPGQSNVVFLQFDADTVTGTNWNYNSGIPNIISHGSNMDDSSRRWVFNWVKSYYQGHGEIAFTTDASVYKAADPAYRQKIIFTTNDTFYCGNTHCAGGVSFIGSFNTNTPDFVFTQALNYSNLNIGQAGGHELGHALGLHHAIDVCGQSYAPNYILCSDGVYRSKIMGAGYSLYQHFFQRPIYTTTLGIPILQVSVCTAPDEDAIIETYLR